MPGVVVLKFWWLSFEKNACVFLILETSLKGFILHKDNVVEKVSWITFSLPLLFLGTLFTLSQHTIYKIALRDLDL